MGQVVHLAGYRAPTLPAIEVGDPAAVAMRLVEQAVAIQARADEWMTVEAEHAGMAAGRLRDGDPLGAEHFEGMRADAARMYLALDEQAFQLRLQAVRLEARAQQFSDLAGVTSFSPGGPF